MWNHRKDKQKILASPPIPLLLSAARRLILSCLLKDKRPIDSASATQSSRMGTKINPQDVPRLGINTMQANSTFFSVARKYLTLLTYEERPLNIHNFSSKPDPLTRQDLVSNALKLCYCFQKTQLFRGHFWLVNLLVIWSSTNALDIQSQPESKEPWWWLPTSPICLLASYNLPDRRLCIYFRVV